MSQFRLVCLLVTIAWISIPCGLLAQQAEEAERAFLRAAVENDQDALSRIANGERGFKANLRLNVGDTPLGVASKLGNLDLVRSLLAAGADPNLADSLGWTPLAWAVIGDFDEIAAALVRGGANIQFRLPVGKTISEFARETGSAVMLASLGIEPPIGDDAAVRLLEEIAANDAAAINAAIAGGARARSTDDAGVPMVFAAAAGGRARSVATLLENGANANDPTPSGFTPLMVAAREGHSEVVALLLAADADPMARSQQGMTASIAAQLHGDAALIRTIELAVASRSPPDGWRFLLAAASRGDGAAVQTFLSAGIPPNGRSADPGGALPLNLAAFAGHRDIVIALLAARADPNQADGRGVTAAMAATLGGQRDLLRLLIGGGADATRPDHDGVAPLSVAIAQGWGAEFQRIAPRTPASSEQLRLAISRGDGDFLRLQFAGSDTTGRRLTPNVRVDGSEGISLLGFAARQGDPAIVDLLLDLGALPDGVNGQRASPLHLAAVGGREEVVRALLQAGADPLARNSDRRTARDLTPASQRQTIALLQAAERRRARELSQALRTFGYNIQVSDAWDDTKQGLLDRFRAENPRSRRDNLIEWINAVDRDAIRVCNPTGQVLFYIRATPIANSQSFDLNGWYEVPSGECRTIARKSDTRMSGLHIQVTRGGNPILRTPPNAPQLCVSDAALNQPSPRVDGNSRCDRASNGRAMRFVPVNMDATQSGLVVAR